MLILETLDNLIFIFSEKTLVSLEIIRESEIIRSIKGWNTGKSNLASNLCEASNKTIEGVINSSIFEFFSMKLFCFEKYLRH